MAGAGQRVEIILGSRTKRINGFSDVPTKYKSDAVGTLLPLKDQNGAVSTR